MPKHNLSTNAFGMTISRRCTKLFTDVTALHRHTNLSLLQAYGSNSWKINNYLLESSATRLEKAVEQLKERTVEINRERKNAQVRMPPLCLLVTSASDTALKTHAGTQITSLETRWTELISNVLQIELANVALEAENAQLAMKEEELVGL